jgi:hypothetical protein
MICPYMPWNCVTKLLKDPDNIKVVYKTKKYEPFKCVKDECPLYSDGECIRAENEKEQ